MSEGLSLAAGAKYAVADYHATHGRFPANNANALIGEPIEGRFTSDVRVVAGGAIRITYDGPEADREIAGKVVILQAAASNAGEMLTWSCSAPDLDPAHLPTACR